MNEKQEETLKRLNAIKRKSHAKSTTILQKRDLFVEAYKLQACRISSACKCIKISRGTFYNWMKDDAAFGVKIKEARDELLDLAESQVYKNVLAGKETSLIFLLCNKRPEEWKNIQRVDMHTFAQSAAFAKKMDGILNTPAPDELKYYSPAQLKQLNKHIAQEMHRREQGAPQKEEKKK